MTQGLLQVFGLFKGAIRSLGAKVSRPVWFLSVASLVGLTVLAAWFWTQSKPPLPVQSFAIGDLAKLQAGNGDGLPEGKFSDAYRQSTALSAWRGQVVLVNLWGVWCAPCLEELPSLAQLSQAYAGQGLSVVAIALDQEARREESQQVLARLTQGELDFYFDPDGIISREAQVYGFPTSLVYNRAGQMIARLDGDADWFSPQARAFIEAVLTAS